jgi:hypothetical protein
MSDNAQSAALLSGGFGYALATITGLLTANGGAAVVIVSLIGSVWGHCAPGEGRALASSLASPLWCFGIGAALAVGTAMASYVSQILINERKPEWVWRSSRIFAGIVGLSSWFALVTGMWTASGIIRGLGVS